MSELRETSAIEMWTLVAKPSRAMDLDRDGARLKGDDFMMHVFNGTMEECQLPVVERQVIVTQPIANFSRN